MKNLIKFLAFIIYSTCIFFLPNNKTILIFIIIDLLIILLFRKNIKSIIRKTINIIPFILFTFAINCIIGNFINAFWVGIKLTIVCVVTITYSTTISITEVAETIQMLCKPLKVFGINIEEIKIVVCISLSMIQILKKELIEVKDACKAKNVYFNMKNIKYILSKLFISVIKRVNQIEEALVAKGYER